MRLRYFSFIFLTLTFVFVSSGFIQERAEQLYQSAIYKEEVEGNLQEAIDLYKKILVKFPENREISAKAQLHIGLCYEKLGLKRAEEAFQNVVDNYPEQIETVKVAKEKLATILRAQSVIKRGDEEFKITKVHKEERRYGGLSPDGKKLALVDYMERGDLYIRDISIGKETLIFSDPTEIIDIYWSPDSKKIAFVRVNLDICIIPIEGGQPKTVVKSDPELEKTGDYIWPSGWTYDGKKVVFYDTSKGLFAVPESGGEGEEIFLFKDPKTAKKFKNMALSPDGKFIAYDLIENGNKDIYVMHVESGESVRITHNPATDRGARWSYDGKWIAFGSQRTGKNEIWVVRITSDGKPGSDPIQITRGGAEGGGWLQDGRFSYSTRKEVVHIFTANIDGSEEMQLTKYTDWNIFPRWSPDGKKIAFVTDYGEERRLAVWVVPSEGGEAKLLAVGQDQTWSPDGKYIAFVPYTGLPPKKAIISIVPAEGGKPKELMAYDGWLRCMDWSPDGKKIVFSYKKREFDKDPIPDSREGIEDIFIVSVDGGEPVRLTKRDKKGFQYTSTRWSPDGNKIAFRSLDYDSWEKGEKAEPISLWIMDIKGGEPKLVTPELGGWHLCWSPDGEYIVSSKREESSKGPWGAGQRIYRVSIDGGAPEDMNIIGYGPDLSQDGKKIAFARSVDYGEEYWIVENFLPE